MNLNTQPPPVVSREQLAKGLGKSAFAFRGYNMAQTSEELQNCFHLQYGPIVERHLRTASEICTNVMNTSVDLVERVRLEKEQA